MTPITLYRREYLKVKPFIATECAGCYYEHDNPCPHNDPHVEVKCIPDEDDFILIRNTPEHIAAYVNERMDNASNS